MTKPVETTLITAKVRAEADTLARAALAHRQHPETRRVRVEDYPYLDGRSKK